MGFLQRVRLNASLVEVHGQVACHHAGPPALPAESCAARALKVSHYLRRFHFATGPTYRLATTTLSKNTTLVGFFVHRSVT